MSENLYELMHTPAFRSIYEPVHIPPKSTKTETPREIAFWWKWSRGNVFNFKVDLTEKASATPSTSCEWGDNNVWVGDNPLAWTWLCAISNGWVDSRACSRLCVLSSPNKSSKLASQAVFLVKTKLEGGEKVSMANFGWFVASSDAMCNDAEMKNFSGCRKRRLFSQVLLPWRKQIMIQPDRTAQITTIEIRFGTETSYRCSGRFDWKSKRQQIFMIERRNRGK